MRTCSKVEQAGPSRAGVPNGPRILRAICCQTLPPSAGAGGSDRACFSKKSKSLSSSSAEPSSRSALLGFSIAPSNWHDGRCEAIFLKCGIICRFSFYGIVALKSFAKLLAGVVQSRLDGAHRQVENICYLRQRKILQVVQNNHNPVHQGERVNDVAHGALQLGALVH